MKALLLTLLLYCAPADTLPVFDTLRIDVNVANMGDTLYIYRRYWQQAQEKRERLVYFVDRKKRITFLRRDAGKRDKELWIY